MEGDESKYRGKIIEIGEGGQISLEYIDYGDTIELASSEVR